MEGYHRSVLLREAIEVLEVRDGKWYLDCTLGDGGHTIEILKNGNDFEGVAKYFKTDKKIFSISFKSQRKGTPADVGEKRGLINLKVIPSAENNKEPEVKQLIVTQYKKQKVNNLEVGEGAVQLHDFAPEYLKKAGIKRVVKSLFLELELIVDGGKIIYNYKSL